MADILWPRAVRYFTAWEVSEGQIDPQNQTKTQHADLRPSTDTWIGAGLRIISLNFPDEIPALAQRYPEIDFISATTRAPNKKVPLLAEMIDTLVQQPEETVGIINADIFLEVVFLKPDEDWLEIIRGATQKAIATGDRVRSGDRRSGSLKVYASIRLAQHDFAADRLTLAQGSTQAEMIRLALVYGAT